MFDRITLSGALAARGCIEEFPIGWTLGTVSDGLNTGLEIAFSPDYTSVYATGVGDSAVSRFDREAIAIEVPPGKVAFKKKGLTCKGACKKTKIKVTVDDPLKVTFASAPACSYCALRAQRQGSERAGSASE